jgi:hypothetical protein
MSQEGSWKESEENIMLDVYDVKSEADIVHLFTEINSAEPVKSIDMPTVDVCIYTSILI